MPATSTGLELGPITLHYFSLLVVLGLAAGTGLAYLRARRFGEDPEYLVDVLTWGIMFALVVARLFYVWNPPPSIAPFYDRGWYLSHPFDLQSGGIAIWSGGLGYAGGLLGALLGVSYVIWRYELPLRRWLHILFPGLLLTLAVTPWGNLLIRQMVGTPTFLPWGLVVDPWPAGFDQPGAFPAGASGFHPLPAYLALWALVCLGAYFAVEQIEVRWLENAEIEVPALLYLAGLFLFDFLRMDVNRGLLTLTGMQWMAVIIAIVLAIWLAIRNRFVSKNHLDSVAGGEAVD